MTREKRNIEINVANLNKRINSLNIGIHQLADLSGWSAPTISEFRSSGKLSQTQLEDICYVLSCSKEYILGNDETYGSRCNYSNTYKTRIVKHCIQVESKHIKEAVINSKLTPAKITKACSLPNGYIKHIMSFGGYFPKSSINKFEKVCNVKLIKPIDDEENKPKPTTTHPIRQKTFVDEYLEQHTEERRKQELEELVSVNRYMIEVQNRIKEVNRRPVQESINKDDKISITDLKKTVDILSKYPKLLDLFHQITTLPDYEIEYMMLNISSTVDVLKLRHKLDENSNDNAE